MPASTSATSSPAKAASAPAAAASPTQRSAEARYMTEHALAPMIEHILEHVVRNNHPRPHQAVALMPIVTPPVQVPGAPDIASADPPKLPPGTADVLDTLHFDVFSCDASATAQDLVDVALAIFVKHGLLAKFEITVPRFRAWANAVRANYRPVSSIAQRAPVPTPLSLAEGDDAVPFHNFRHAINVLHTLHVFLHSFNARSHFDDLEVFAMLVSAMCHDLQHPGRDNGFLMKVGSTIARRYNDVAVLEQHHCATTFAILDDPVFDITSAFRKGPNGLPSEDFKRFRACVCRCILATEVASHKKHIQALNDALGAGFSAANDEHRFRLMVSLVEAADVSNECRAFPFSRQWAAVVEEEFCRQGDAERALGLDVPASRDRQLVVMGKEQCGFIDFLCLPLYEALAKVVPGMSECVKNLQANRATWHGLSSTE